MSHYTKSLKIREGYDGVADAPVYRADDLEIVERFLILGTTTDQYYADKHELTSEHIDNILNVAKKSGWDVVIELASEISINRRAIRQEPALFVLALASAEKYNPDRASRNYALNSAMEACVTLSMLMQFVSIVTEFRGWGRLLRDAVASWFNNMGADKLDLQLAKYRKRYGFTPEDLLRLCHVAPVDSEHNELYAAVTGKRSAPSGTYLDGTSRALSESSTKEDVVYYIEKYGLTWEMIPTKFLNEQKVWMALLPNTPSVATLRNLPKLASLDLLSTKRYGESALDVVLSKLKNARAHPARWMMALLGFQKGRNRNFGWTPNPKIVVALQDGFYNSFHYLPDLSTRYEIGIDVSGSMGGQFGDIGMRSSLAAAVIAMTLKAQAPHVGIWGFAHNLMDLNHLDVDTPIKEMETTIGSFGSTDVGLIIRKALRDRRKVDCFVVITDNCHNTDNSVYSTLKKYDYEMGTNAKIVAIATNPYGLTVFPSKPGKSLNVVGFSPDIPKVVAEFAK